MRILVTSIVDVQRAPNGRLHSVVEALSERHELTVVCPYDTWREKRGRTDRYGSGERLRHLGNVEVVALSELSLPTTVQEGAAELFVPFLDVDYGSFDVHFDYNSLGLGVGVGRRARRAGVPTVYDLADDVVAMARESPQLPGLLRPAAGVAAGLAVRRNVAAADHVTCTTESLRERFDVPRFKSTVIPNGVDIDQFTPDVTPRTDAGPDTEFVVGYVGTNREWVELECVVEAVARLRENGVDVGVLVVGDEGGLSSVRERARDLGVEDACAFTGTVPYDEVPSHVAAMDVGTIPFDASATSEHSLPLKLFEYLAVGVPAVSSRLPAVENAAADVVRFAGTTDEWAAAITGTVAESARSDRREQGRALVVETYSWAAQVAALEGTLEQLACRTAVEVPSRAPVVGGR
jgi:glycosyltransferase involved in cell wall biosynthesis